MTGRERLIGAATAVLLAASVGFVVYGGFSAGDSAKEADAVNTELIRMYAAGSGRPNLTAVRVHLAVPTDDNVPRFPTPRGTKLRSFGITDDGVTIMLRGSSRAVGWCFRVAYTDDRPADVAASSRCP